MELFTTYLCAPGVPECVLFLGLQEPLSYDHGLLDGRFQNDG